MPYSEEPGTEFYEMVEEVYDISFTLTPEQISIVKTWADMPGNYGTPAHYHGFCFCSRTYDRFVITYTATAQLPAIKT